MSLHWLQLQQSKLHLLRPCFLLQTLNFSPSSFTLLTLKGFHHEYLHSKNLSGYPCTTLNSSYLGGQIFNYTTMFFSLFPSSLLSTLRKYSSSNKSMSTMTMDFFIFHTAKMTKKNVTHMSRSSPTLAPPLTSYGTLLPSTKMPMFSPSSTPPATRGFRQNVLTSSSPPIHGILSSMVELHGLLYLVGLFLKSSNMADGSSLRAHECISMLLCAHNHNTGMLPQPLRTCSDIGWCHLVLSSQQK